MSFYDDASLMLLASGGAQKDGKVYSVKPTDGAGDFTFTRGSNLSATRVNASQLIEKGRENLLLRSNAFNLWSGSLTLTSGQSGYDGSSDAWLLDATSVNQFIYRNDVTSFSGVTTISVYAKKGTADGIRLRFNQTSDSNIFIDLNDGSDTFSAINVISHSATSVGGGWYRIQMSFVASGSQDVRIYPTNATGTSIAGTIYIQDSQAELGLVATDYIETGASTAQAGILEDTPRFDYSGGATCPSLLLEPSRANLLPYSEYISGWSSKSAVYHTNGANATTSPEGLSNGWKITGDGTSGQHYILQSANYTSGTAYTCSIFAKADTNNYIQLILGAAPFSSTNYCNFDLSDGSIGTTGSTISDEFIEDYGDGWYRIGFSATALSTGSGNFFPTLVTSSSATFFESNTTTGSVFFYGGMVEQGSYATSYIPNHSGGTITRAGDVCGDAGTSATFNSTEGVLYAEISALDTSGTYRLISLSSGSDANRIFIGLNTATGYLYYYVIVGGAVKANFTTSIYPSEFTKVAVKYKENDFAFWINGVEVSSDSSGTTFPANTLNVLQFNSASPTVPFYGKTKQVIVFPTALSDADLTTLTTL